MIFKVDKAWVAPIAWRVRVPVPLLIVRSSSVPSTPSIDVLNVITPSLASSLLSMITVPLTKTLSLKTISLTIRF